jgi:hypothetical protein
MGFDRATGVLPETCVELTLISDERKANQRDHRETFRTGHPRENHGLRRFRKKIVCIA